MSKEELEEFEREVLGEVVKIPKIELVSIDDLVPYEKNPRVNDSAVDVVAKSIKEYGFKVPIIVDKDNVIIAGHTRFKAANKLGLKVVPVIRALDLSDEQVKAFRIMDNKSGEFANWNYDLLNLEIEDLKKINFNIDLTGFNFGEFDSEL